MPDFQFLLGNFVFKILIMILELSIIEFINHVWFAQFIALMNKFWNFGLMVVTIFELPRMMITFEYTLLIAQYGAHILINSVQISHVCGDFCTYHIFENPLFVITLEIILYIISFHYIKEFFNTLVQCSSSLVLFVDMWYFFIE